MYTCEENWNDCKVQMGQKTSDNIEQFKKRAVAKTRWYNLLVLHNSFRLSGSYNTVRILPQMVNSLKDFVTWYTFNHRYSLKVNA